MSVLPKLIKQGHILQHPAALNSTKDIYQNVSRKSAIMLITGHNSQTVIWIEIAQLGDLYTDI